MRFREKDYVENQRTSKLKNNNVQRIRKKHKKKILEINDHVM